MSCAAAPLTPSRPGPPVHCALLPHRPLVVVCRSGWYPTHQANGLQTAAMARAFDELGCAVELAFLAREDDVRVRTVHDLPLSITLRHLRRAVVPCKKRFWPGRGLRNRVRHLHARL